MTTSKTIGQFKLSRESAIAVYLLDCTEHLMSPKAGKDSSQRHHNSCTKRMMALKEFTIRQSYQISVVQDAAVLIWTLWQVVVVFKSAKGVVGRLMSPKTGKRTASPRRRQGLHKTSFCSRISVGADAEGCGGIMNWEPDREHLAGRVPQTRGDAESRSTIRQFQS